MMMHLELQVWPLFCTCRKGTAEDLPFPDGSVDLLTAASAAHWFDQSRFLTEASRVLKPRGCMALLGYSDTNMRFHYQDCGERLNHIFQEVSIDLYLYCHGSRVKLCQLCICTAITVSTIGSIKLYYLNFTISETLICIHFQVRQILLPYTSSPVAAANGKLEELYSAIPFPDKER